MSNLNPQQFSPEDLDTLRAGDFPGSIGDAAAEKRFDRYNSHESMRYSHVLARGPLNYLDQFTQRVAAEGKIHEPIEVVKHDDYYQVHDGHHRALVGKRLGIPVPYKVLD